MFSLDISAIALEVPERATQKSKLGTMMPRAYNHLFDLRETFLARQRFVVVLLQCGALPTMHTSLQTK